MAGTDRLGLKAGNWIRGVPILNYQFLINNHANYVNKNKISVLNWLNFLFSMVFVLIRIRIQGNDADQGDPDPQHC